MPSRKKRRNDSPHKLNQQSHNNNHRRRQSQPRHWDEPALEDTSMNYDTSAGTNIADPSVDVGVKDEEMSRVLTSAEVWDDSALIEAWESATAEYEVLF
jgi:hypothetical protein